VSGGGSLLEGRKGMNVCNRKAKGRRNGEESDLLSKLYINHNVVS
jgi:hypothetical protein